MSHVVCEPCRDCKYTDCVVVCPCECFYQDASMLYIDPSDCIDCGACIPECPVSAIHQEHDVPEKWTRFIEINLQRSRELIASGGARVLEKQTPAIRPGCTPV